MLLTSSLHNIKMSDAKCLLSVFHFLLIENNIASMFTPIEQIQLHEDQGLKMYNAYNE